VTPAVTGGAPSPGRLGRIRGRLPERATAARVARRVGWSTASGLLMVLSVPRFDLWPCMWVALLPALHVALTSASPRRAFAQGWWTGIVANTVAFWWMRGLLERFAHLPAVAAIPIMLLLTCYQGLEFGLWAYAVHRLARRRARVRMAWLAPLAMVAVELLVPQIFPFYLAISQARVLPVIQIADLTGPMGITFVLVMASGALHDAARAGGLGAALGALGVPAAVVAGVLGYGGLRLHQIDARRRMAPHARVGLVQANVGIEEKWDPGETDRLLRLHRAESARLVARGAELVVWPESSYPYPLPRDFRHDFPPGDPRRLGGTTPTPLVFGALTMAEPRPGGGPLTGKDRFPYNTAFMLDGDGRVAGSYDKVFLLIFGEYIPLYDSIPWFTRLVPEASNFSRGDRVTTFPLRLGARTYRLGPLICYEDILAGFTRRVAAEDPNLLVNITNDAWFGDTAEPYQHLALAVFRAVEHRLDLVRAVNTGVSAHVDATGRVVAKIDAVDPDAAPPPAPAGLLADVALLERGGLYVHVGDAFAVACVACLVGLWLGWSRHSARKKKG
jgi:apolipoprotein N-acyltransferase